MKKKVNRSDLDANNGEVLLKQKERHIVSWSQEEDDILREQIRLHGTENWAIIASKFKDKTTRQCRRRWFTYLNSDFKKGGWSPEEDMLLCEAQKIYGNRWTEIAKVVSGRTDNAVKNRFTTLCKKRAKENNTTSYINLNNKRVISGNGIYTDGGLESTAKKIRTYGSSSTGNYNAKENVLRQPFAVISRSGGGYEVNFPTGMHLSEIKEALTDGSMGNDIQPTFIKKDDPKVVALMQQAELLSSLAIKVNSEKTDQSLENAWTILQDFLEKNKESELLAIRNSDIDVQVEKFKELVEDIRSCNEDSGSSWQEPDLYESSPASSEYSTGSTLMSNVPHDKQEECEAEVLISQQEQLNNQPFLTEKNGICHTAGTNEVNNVLTCNDIKPETGAVCEYPAMEFSSPIHVTPLFRALAAAVPSPRFSESEKHFLMKTLGMESTSPNPVANSSQPPPCKRSLLHCL